jgi:DNA-binding FrmR family transcriptional regulator
MAHTIKDKKKLLDRVRRIRGQVEGIEKALVNEAECTQVLHNISGCRGAINGLLSEVLEGYIRSHVMTKESEQREASQELIELLHSYGK